MSLPRFFSRIDDSLGPLLMAATNVRELLSSKSVLLEASDNLPRHPLHRAGFLLLVNLCARLYPAIRISAPAALVEDAKALALQINPSCEIVVGRGRTSGVVAWCCVGSGSEAITVAPAGWDVLVDLPRASQIQPTNMLTSLAAGAIGAAELFRQVFAEYLPKPRTGASPGTFNVLTHAPTSELLPELPSDIALGRVHLVGAGAVGQAAVYTLARVSATGVITVVDPEDISLSNLQRYVLALDADVGADKCSLIERHLRPTRIEVVSVRSAWSADSPETKNAEVICAAVDSEETRIGIQASLPRRVYNAWTQPSDVGWSRHERFGVDPCAACLYWPTGSRPSYHELVARALRQHELRVIAYLTLKLPVDQPLDAAQIPTLAQYPRPGGAGAWTERSLLDDVSEALGVDATDVQQWQGRPLSELYREGICAGALIRKQRSELPVEVAVPLAHQSVFAGVMLATQLLVAARPELVPYRNPFIEARLDLLSGLPQVIARPRQRTPNCICSDTDFQEAYRAKWPWTST